jgi:hypothetical protein
VSADCDTCGVLAIGRCIGCGAAFCLSHQGRTPPPSVPYVDLCSTCTAKQRQAEQNQRATDAAPENWVKSQGAKVLRGAGVPMTALWEPVRLAKRWWESSPREEMRESESESERGWFLGNVLWQYSWETAGSGGNERMLRPTFLMPKAQYLASSDGPLRLVDSTQGLMRADRVGAGHVLDWAGAESAVRRLAGK